MKKITFLLLISFLFAVNLSAQPQYYNYQNVGSSSNTFPFGQTNGKAVNWLFLAGDLNQPTPCPSGQQITTVYFYLSSGGSRTYTNLHVLMAQDNITTLTTGQFYAGPWDTVYYKASETLTGTTNAWVSITLDTPYPYDPTKSLIIFVGQCGGAGSGMYVRQNVLANIRRVWSVGGCPFVPYAGGDGSTVNFGIDVVPAPPPVCNYYSSQWCAAGTFPNLPAATFFQASAWLGDTLYVQAPTTSGAGANTVYRYTYGGSWSTGVPLPATRVGGTLTACNGKLYYIGGGSSSISTGQTNTVYEYDPAAGTWTTKAVMPLALAAHGAECWGDSVIFVWGGPYTGSTTQLNVYYYRVGSDSWGTITNSLPTGQGRRTFSHGLSGNKLFMAAGYNTTYLKSFYIGTIGSNASQLTWTAGPDVPTTFTGLSRPGGVAYQKIFYMIGGEQAGGGYHQTAYAWLVEGNAWYTTTIQPKPAGMSNIFSACVAKCINDTVKVFVPGGYTGAASNLFDVIGCGPSLLTGIGTITSNIPDVYSLSQNYPNPFNPITKIAFSLPKAGDVKLVVYDILGREVATLVNEHKTAGVHTIEFNAENLASGVYLYQISAGDFVETKRMMLIK